MPEPTLTVRVCRIRREAIGINSYELADRQGGDLPEFAAGAHIDVHLPGGAVRQYSLCGDPADRGRWLIAVLAEADGEGASGRLHREIREGDALLVSAPRNRFPLVEGAPHYLLLAGGIGVTPLLSMAARLAATGADFMLHCCTKSPRHTPFRDRLRPLARAGRVRCHHDGGDPRQGLDLGALLRAPRPGTELYFCGPLGFMQAVREAAAAWPQDSVHCEYFMPEAAPDSEPGLDRFEIVLAASGTGLRVGPGQSLFEVLCRAGLMSPPACADGGCGRCRVRWLAGDPLHRDRLLTDSERGEYVLACRTGSRAPRLVLDL
jgi:ferredoxin-NADP reductase